MPSLTGPVQVFSTDIFSSSASPQHALGQVGETRNGRRFRYCQAGASALVVGNVIQAPAQIANHQQLTPTVTTYGLIGQRYIQATTGATAGAANLYSNGWAIIDTTPGLGYAYAIESHPAIAGSDLVLFTLQPDSLVEVSLTSSSRVSLQINPYKNVIQHPVTTGTGVVVGVAVYPIAATEWGWVQTRGPGAVLIAGTPAVGTRIVVPATSAGAVVALSATAATNAVQSDIGRMMVTGVDGKVQAVMIDIN